jgi:hypothetical protein
MARFLYEPQGLIELVKAKGKEAVFVSFNPKIHIVWIREANQVTWHATNCG